MIGPFIEEYRFLSNFYPCDVKYKGILFPSVENAFQFAKIPSKNVKENNIKFFQECTALEAKRSGKTIKPIETNWKNLRNIIMQDLVEYKFSNNFELKELLLATGTEDLVEINTWGDTYWGMYNGIGQNNLGKILMSVRTGIRFNIRFNK